MSDKTKLKKGKVEFITPVPYVGLGKEDLVAVSLEQLIEAQKEHKDELALQKKESDMKMVKGLAEAHLKGYEEAKKEIKSKLEDILENKVKIYAKINFCEECQKQPALKNNQLIMYFEKDLDQAIKSIK